MQYKKSLISTTFALGTLIVGSAHAEWKYNTEVFFAASDDASVSGIRWLQPWWQNGKSMAYTDVRVLKSDKSTEELNLGGGFRQLNDAESAIWGGYGFLDYRKSATDRTFTQLTVGGEYLLDKWEFRSNFYLPIKDEYIVGENDGEFSVEDNFTGNTVTRITTITPGTLVVEEALQGYDLEGGYLLPGSEDFEIRANLGIYQYSAPVAGSTQGLRARFEAFPRENFKVSATIESDDLFGTRSFLELSLPLGRKIGRPGKRSLQKRMTQFAYRDIDVRETSRLAASKRTKVKPGSADVSEPEILEENVLHIDSSRGVDISLADGSIELPFQSIADCEASACSAPELDTTYYLHANASASSNGNAQHYIGHFDLSDNQKIVGDGVTTGNFRNLSTGVSPILLGVDGTADPVLTLAGTSQAAGLQLGWDYTQTTPGSSTVSLAPLPAGAGMPDIAVLVANQGTAGVNVGLEDIIITGASAFDGDDTRINSGNNFSTGIHFFSDDAENTLGIARLTTNFVLGDAVHAELTNPNNDSFISQTLGITNSNIAKNGRGVHATVDGVTSSSAEQIVFIRAPNSEGDNLTNLIEFNLNEGILMENLAIDDYAIDLAANQLDPLNDPVPFLATQNLTVRNALIQNNQGAGIQTNYGAITDNSQLDTATVRLRNVNLFLNEGSGLVLGSLSSNVEAELEDVSISGNIDKSATDEFGLRLDGAAIDCGTPGVAACAITTDTANADRDNDDFRKTGYGLYAKNQDTTGSLGTQNITISNNFQVLFHEENAAQIFLESVGLAEDASSQTLNILDEADFVKVIGGEAGEIQIVDGRFTVGRTGASIEGVAYCDEDSSPSAVDNNAPHINFTGLVDEDGSSEICQ